MIEMSGVRTLGRGDVLADVSFKVAAGVHALVGGPSDGARALVSVLLGETKPASGWVARFGERAITPETRRAIAHVPRTPPSVAPLSVSELLDIAADVRAEARRSANLRLAPLGAEALAPRSVLSLSVPELRAVLLAEALSSEVVTTLILDDPDHLPPTVEAALHGALREWGARGGICLLGTNSISAAVRLADSILLFRHGTLVRHAAATDAFFCNAEGGTALQIVTAGARELVAELAREPDVTGIETRGGGVVVRGDDLTSLSRAVARALARTTVDIVSLRRCPSMLYEVQSPPDTTGPVRRGRMA